MGISRIILEKMKRPVKSTVGSEMSCIAGESKYWHNSLEKNNLENIFKNCKCRDAVT